MLGSGEQLDVGVVRRRDGVASRGGVRGGSSWRRAMRGKMLEVGCACK